MTDAARRNWLMALEVALAALYLYVGVAAHGLARWLALGGGTLIIAALIAGWRSRPVARPLLLIGALPVAVVTWWSIVTPMLGVLAVVIGWMAVKAVRTVPARSAGT
jgi:hypothetical protein